MDSQALNGFSSRASGIQQQQTPALQTAALFEGAGRGGNGGRGLRGPGAGQALGSADTFNNLFDEDLLPTGRGFVGGGAQGRSIPRGPGGGDANQGSLAHIMDVDELESMLFGPQQVRGDPRGWTRTRFTGARRQTVLL
eukprot:141159-Prorocentrum_minimum.AAC.1